MPMKTLRLAPDDEKLLARIRRETGLTASDVLKRGLRALARELSAEPSTRAWEIYKSLDLGPGGDAALPSTATREQIRDLIMRKHRR
jgi:hypothetical protein